MAPPPPLPYRARGLEWLLAVGVVLIASAGAATTAALGGDWVRVLLLGLAMAAAAASWSSARACLARSEEALAAVAVALAALGSDPGSPVLRGSVWPPAVVGTAFLVLAVVLPGAASWPLAAWAAAQVAALRALDGVPDGLPLTALAVGVAVGGLVVACLGRSLVARAVLLTALPWWVAGVVAAVRTAWSGEGPGRWLPVALTTVAALGLLVARQRPVLQPLLGPAAAAPLLAGAAVGSGVAAALHAPGPVAVPLAGYLGVATVSTAASLLRGWWRRTLLPAAVTVGTTMAVVCLVQLLAGARWTALTWLLAFTGALSLLTAGLRRDERPGAIPTAVACWGAAVLCTVPTGDLGGPRGSAVALGVLFLGTLAGSLWLEAGTRRPTVLTGAACAVGAVVLLVVLRERGQMVAQLAVQGTLTCLWGWGTWRRALRAARDPVDVDPGTVVPVDPPEEEVAPAPPEPPAELRAARSWLQTARRRLHEAVAVPAPHPDPGAGLAPADEPPAADNAPPPAPVLPHRPREAAPADPEETVPGEESLPAWRAGALQLVVAAWTWADLADKRVLESYTLPAAAGLLLAAGPRLARGRSAPTWGPGLWVAAAPSVVWAVLEPGSWRPVAVFAVAAAVLGLAAWQSVRAPLVAGALTAVTLALGLLAMQLSVAVAGAVVTGAALLGVGAWREAVARRRQREAAQRGGAAPGPEPVDGFRRRLAAMR